MTHLQARGRAMIELIEGLPDNVVGLVVKGRVTPHDVAEVLVPAIEQAREWHHRLRLYYEIRSRYPGATWGAAWGEAGLGPDYAPVWERVAVVSDVAWIRHTVQALRLLIPSEIRVFSTLQIPDGLGWIAARAVPMQHPASAASLRRGQSRRFRPSPQYLHQPV